MQLNQEQWHVRLFFWSLGIWDAFMDRNTKVSINRYGTNLCFFVRVMVIGAPLVLALHAVVYGAAIAALTAVPVILFGFSWYLAGVAAITTIVLFIRGIKKFWDWRQDRYWERKDREHARAMEPPTEVHMPTPTLSFWAVVREWIKAHKAKICPMITFQSDKRRNHEGE